MREDDINSKIELLPNKSVATLVPTKSDEEYANELKERLLEAYKPVMEILTEAKRNKFEVNVQSGANGFGQVQINSLMVMRVY